ncbi:MAG TPA: MobF family relaxase [Lacipirellulaceae bacterium]|jgi:conjugative relaxase-like TrwC/TraI family protein|nr:MobF family relaxase [Lacipirellulaceae bacterium]
MLRINQNSHAAGAKSYYTTSDYYVDGQERAGVWRGEGAKKLGLSGEIQRADWDALCDGLDPKSGEKLLQRIKDNRTVGYDFNFHVPKSVSVLYAATKDERIVDAFRASVDATMREIETEMQTRVRKDGKNEDRRTGNMLWGEFVHFTSRPMHDGVPDPHLHAHCFVLNTTWDAEEKAWKSGQFRPVVSDAAYFASVFHSRFANKLADLGLPIERTKNRWEIGGGMPKSLIRKFSRRTALIEETAREKGIEDPKAKSELGAKTRSRKAKNMSMPQLQAEWRSRMSPQELEALAHLEKLIGGDARPTDEGSAERAVAFAIGHEFERRSVVPERQLLATALKHAVGRATPEQVLKQIDRSGVIIGERKGRRMATTREVLGEERRIIDFARSGRGAAAPLGKPDYKLKKQDLDGGQQAAVRHILGSRDRIMIVRGIAGAGKTTLIREAVAAIEENGTKVLPLAPTAKASRGVLRDEGFDTADTVARLLLDQRLQQASKGKVLWIDEAGLIGARTMANVLALADKLDCRVLLTGDARQHAAVEHGSVLQMLEDEAGIRPAEVTEIQRPKGKDKEEYKKIVKSLSEGKVKDGISQMDKLGWIRELPEDERYKQLATDYVDTVAKKQSALCVSPTHAEADRITDEIRNLMKERGLLAREERTFTVLENANLTDAERGDPLSYLPGDVLQFHQNAKGFTRGDRVSVNGDPLPLDQAKRFTVFHPGTLKLAAGDIIRITTNGSTADGKHRLDNGFLYRIKSFDGNGNIVLSNGWTIGKDFGHIAMGHVVTSYSSQGKTVDRVFIGQSSLSLPASSREQFYVSCSRGRYSATVYCDNKEALKDAVSQSDERITATQLINQRQRNTVALQKRHVAAFEPAKQQQGELSRDR